jgi:predicted amidohydrolase
MADRLRLCMAQMTSSNRYAPNIAFAEDAAAHAAREGCDLLALPEVSGLMTLTPQDPEAPIGTAADNPFLTACKALAKAHGLWIHTGSTPVTGPEEKTGGRFYNHAELIDPSGQVTASYNKIHLFDIQLDGKPPTGESQRYAPGDAATLVQTPWGAWGLSICYDLRFPHLYRHYAQAGAGVLFIPSAFTVPTGRAHWEVLLRARAIENGAFVVAPAQVGQHDDGRKTYGHAVVVDPWGEVICDMGGDAPGLAVLDLDLSKIAKARRQIPALTHDRPYS